MALAILYSAKKLAKNIVAGYVDHGMYLNGILFQIFLKKKLLFIQITFQEVYLESIDLQKIEIYYMEIF